MGAARALLRPRAPPGLMNNAVFEALSHPDRRRILQMLKAKGELAAGDIADAFEMSRPTMSHHLKALLQAGLIDRERRGTFLFYRINLSAFEETLQVLMTLFDVRNP